MVYARTRSSRRGGRRSIKSRGTRKVSRRKRSYVGRVGRFTAARRSVIPRSLFPERKIVAMTYSTLINLDPLASGAIARHTFLSNGLWDPDYTGAGHQPRGFDQMMEFYQYATVVSSKFSAIFGNNTTGLGFPPFVYGIWKNNRNQGGTAVDTYHDLVETGSCKVNYSNLTQDTGPRQVIMKFNTKKDLSVTSLLDQPNLHNSSTANPTSFGSMEVFAGPMNSSTDMPNINVVVNIRFIVLLHGRIAAPES